MTTFLSSFFLLGATNLTERAKVRKDLGDRLRSDYDCDSYGIGEPVEEITQDILPSDHPQTSGKNYQLQILNINLVGALLTKNNKLLNEV